MNIFRDIILRFLIIPECIKKFLSSFVKQYQPFFAPFTKKIIWMSSEPFSSNITSNACSKRQNSPYSVRARSSNRSNCPPLDAEHRERLTLFFFPFSPPSFLSFFFSRKKRMYRARGWRSIISRDCLSSLDEIAGSVGGFVFRPIFTVKNRDIRCYDRCLSSS